MDRRERSGVRGIRTDRNRWKNHVTNDELGDTILSSIGRRDILDWLDRRKGEHQTRKNALNLLRVALQEALDRELITSNPARDVRIRATRSMAEDDLEGILSPAEQQRLLKAVPEASRPMVVFALLTGIRQAEQWWLKPEDVSRSSIIIRRSSRGKAPKNGKNRTVFLLEPAQRALELARDDSDWVWPAKRGGRRPEGKAPRGWHRWVKAAKLRWHDLRHTCATSLLAGWWGRKWSLDEVCQMLGHSSVKVTERYARKLAETMRLAVSETMFPKSSPLLLPKITKTAGKMRGPGLRALGLITTGEARRGAPGQSIRIQNDVPALRVDRRIHGWVEEKVVRKLWALCLQNVEQRRRDAFDLFALQKLRCRHPSATLSPVATDCHCNAHGGNARCDMPRHAARAPPHRQCYLFCMMTRAHVARRLGKSIATVRRMEGVDLHPRLDDRGVNRFDPTEVESIAARHSGAAHRRPRSSDAERIGQTGEEPEARATGETQERVVSELRQALESEFERGAALRQTIEQLQLENRDLREAVRTCASLVLETPDREQLSELGESGIEALEQMLELCG